MQMVTFGTTVHHGESPDVIITDLVDSGVQTEAEEIPILEVQAIDLTPVLESLKKIDPIVEKLAKMEEVFTSQNSMLETLSTFVARSDEVTKLKSSLSDKLSSLDTKIEGVSNDVLGEMEKKYEDRSRYLEEKLIERREVRRRSKRLLRT